MVTVKPFKGFLANKGVAQQLISPPYDVINTSEARKMAKGNPFSFLNVNKPEITLDEKTDPYSPMVYEAGKVNLQTFINRGWLEQDSDDRFYIYE